MSEHHRRHHDAPRREYWSEPDRSWRPATDESERWAGSESDELARRAQPSRPGWYDQGDRGDERVYTSAPPRGYGQSGRDGQYSGGWTDDRGRQEARPQYGYGQYGGSQYGGASSAGRGYPESDFHPHSARQDPRYQGGGGWSTGGYGGGETSFAPTWPRTGPSRPAAIEQDFRGRGPKDYRRSDDRIREDASDRLHDDPGVDASEITVHVQDGEVTLTGMVNSRDQKRRAEDCVEQVSGVREVSNHLRINRDGQAARGASTDENLFDLTGKNKEDSRATVDTATRRG